MVAAVLAGPPSGCSWEALWLFLPSPTRPIILAPKLERRFLSSSSSSLRPSEQMSPPTLDDLVMGAPAGGLRGGGAQARSAWGRGRRRGAAARRRRADVGPSDWSLAYLDVPAASSSSSSTDSLFCRTAPPSASPTTSCVPSDPKSTDWPSARLSRPIGEQHADGSVREETDRRGRAHAGHAPHAWPHRCHGDPSRSHLILEAERTSADTSLTSLSDDFRDRPSLTWRRTQAR